MNTWELVDSSLDAIPIANKWVLLKKYNKQEVLIKYKAMLVAKGCAQRSGFDFNETFSSVVCLKIIRAILVMVPGKKLSVMICFSSLPSSSSCPHVLHALTSLSYTIFTYLVISLCLPHVYFTFTSCHHLYIQVDYCPVL